MQVIIGTGQDALDITAAIQESTYDINSVKQSTSWRDAAFVAHQYAIYNKIEGSFDIVCIPDLTIAYSDLLTALGAATSGGVTTLSVTVNNLDEESKTINCFVDITSNNIRKISDTVKYKRFTVNIKEC